MRSCAFAAIRCADITDPLARLHVRLHAQHITAHQRTCRLGVVKGILGAHTERHGLGRAAVHKHMAFWNAFRLAGEQGRRGEGRGGLPQEPAEQRQLLQQLHYLVRVRVGMPVRVGACTARQHASAQAVRLDCSR